MKVQFDKTAGTFSGIDCRLEIWRKAYPAVDVGSALSRAAAWLIANPRNTKKNYERFLTNWLSREQERAPRSAASSTQPPPTATASEMSPVQRSAIQDALRKHNAV